MRYNGSKRVHYIRSLLPTFLGAFTEFKKATIGFVMSVRMGQLSSHWTDFHEILYLKTFFFQNLPKILKFD